MKKGRRFIRQRVSESDSDSENKNSKDAVNAVTTEIQPQKSEKNPIVTNKIPSKTVPASSVLSFDIEEEGESFKIKKSSHNRKTVKQLKKAQKQEKIHDNDLRVQSKQEKDFNLEINKIKLEEDYFEDDENEDENNRNEKPKHYSDILKSGGIPDANLIHLLKQKRQQAKGEDFIALDNVSINNKSRLIRDDDNDVSDDEGCSNMMSAVSQKHKDEQRNRIQETILTAQDESDSEKECDWEEMQMKKAMSDGPFFSDLKFHAPFNALHQNPFRQVNGGSTGPMKRHKTLKQKLTDLQEQTRMNRHDREEVLGRMQVSLDDTQRLGSNREPYEIKYKFYQEMHAFVLDYVDCMNEKMSSITYLDKCMTQLLQQTSTKLVQRRQNDVNDQSSECLTGKTGVEEEIKKRRRAEREGRRARRRRARDAKGLKEHREGWSTDEELTHSEQNKFNNEKERVAEGCRTCLDDVVEQFHNMPSILQRFTHWKMHHHDSYSDAYIGLCLSRLLTPLIKLQLVTWHPLETYCRNIEKAPWFLDLLSYGNLLKEVTFNEKNTKGNYSSTNLKDKVTKKDKSEDSHEKDGQEEKDAEAETEKQTNEAVDPDIKLLPNVIDKILVNKITGVVDSIWDPMSRQQSSSLCKVVAQVLTDYSLFLHDSKSIQALVTGINKRLLKSIDSDLFIPLLPRASIEDRNSPASSFFHRQLHTCLKAFCNTLLWKGVLSDQYLQTLAFERILNRYLLIAIQSAPLSQEIISACHCIASSIPPQWFSEYVEGVCMPQLEQFCRLIVSMAHKLHATPTHESKANVKQLVKVLMLMHAEAPANALNKMLS